MLGHKSFQSTFCKYKYPSHNRCTKKNVFTFYTKLIYQSQMMIYHVSVDQAVHQAKLWHFALYPWIEIEIEIEFRVNIRRRPRPKCKYDGNFNVAISNEKLVSKLKCTTKRNNANTLASMIPYTLCKSFVKLKEHYFSILILAFIRIFTISTCFG